MLFVASFEADATEALHYMHGSSIVHCDHKLPNILICRSGGPMGFVGKVTDPGVWYGESGFGDEGTIFRKDEIETREKCLQLQSVYYQASNPRFGGTIST